MANNPYATPESNVSHHSAEVENGSIFWGSGRLSVASYFGQAFLLGIVYYILLFGIGMIAIALGGGGSADFITNPGGAMAGSNIVVMLLGLAIVLVVTWVSFCQMIKRFHDRNLSGWWVLTTLVVVGLIILFIPGKTEPNRFGAWRQSRVWEKILAGLLLLLIIAMFAAGAYFGFAGIPIE